MTATGFSNADKPFAKLTAPLAPSLLPRVLAALETCAVPGRVSLPSDLRALAAELRRYIADEQDASEFLTKLRADYAQKYDELVDAKTRIAELETALRRAHGRGCICVACEKIPAAARSEGET